MTEYVMQYLAEPNFRWSKEWEEAAQLLAKIEAEQQGMDVKETKFIYRDGVLETFGYAIVVGEMRND